jgi:hypothetical protein
MLPNSRFRRYGSQKAGDAKQIAQLWHPPHHNPFSRRPSLHPKLYDRGLRRWHQLWRQIRHRNPPRSSLSRNPRHHVSKSSKTWQHEKTKRFSLCIFLQRLRNFSDAQRLHPILYPNRKQQKVRLREHFAQDIN